MHENCKVVRKKDGATDWQNKDVEAQSDSIHKKIVHCAIFRQVLDEELSICHADFLNLSNLSMLLEVSNKNINILEQLQYFEVVTWWKGFLWGYQMACCSLSSCCHLCGLGVDALGWLLQVSPGKDFVLPFSGVDGYAVHHFCNIELRFRFWFGKGVILKFSLDMLVTSKLISPIFSVSFVSRLSGFMFLKYSKVFNKMKLIFLSEFLMWFQTFFPTLLQIDYFIFHSVGLPVM